MSNMRSCLSTLYLISPEGEHWESDATIKLPIIPAAGMALYSEGMRKDASDDDVGWEFSYIIKEVSYDMDDDGFFIYFERVDYRPPNDTYKTEEQFQNHLKGLREMGWNTRRVEPDEESG